MGKSAISFAGKIKGFSLVAALICGGGALVSGGVAQASEERPGLRAEPTVTRGLITLGVADEIRQNCDTISPRVITAMMYMRSLQRRARDLGYSDDEIETYVEDDVEEARLRVFVDAYLSANGVLEGAPETYCALGLAEISRHSQIAALLRAQ